MTAVAHDRKRILYVQYTNPGAYPPLMHSAELLADAGASIVQLGTTQKESVTFESTRRDHVRVRLWRYRRPGLMQKLHYFAFAAWSLLWCLRWRPHWVYASDPLSCPIALMLSLLPGIRLAYHEHDSPAASPPPAGFMRLVHAARRRAARRARLCILPNQRRADVFRQTLGPAGSVMTVWNCPRTAEVSPPIEERPGPSFRLYYHGSITPERLPLGVVRALAGLPSQVDLHIVGYEAPGSPGHVAGLLAEARRLGAEGRVHYRGAVPDRSSALSAARSADLGLSLIGPSPDPNMAAMAGASNKTFDYLACGVPLLVSNEEEWRRLFVEPGYGLGCDPSDENSIARAISWALANRAELRAMGERGRRRILSEWNYDVQFQPVLRRLLACSTLTLDT